MSGGYIPPPKKNDPSLLYAACLWQFWPGLSAIIPAMLTQDLPFTDPKEIDKLCLN